MRALLAVLLLLGAGSALAGPAAPVLPLPAPGELYFYTGTAEGQGGSFAVAKVMRFLEPEKLVDRLGGEHTAILLDTAYPHDRTHQGPDDILHDAQAYHALLALDAATRERLEVRTASTWHDSFPLLPGLPAGSQDMTSRYAMHTLADLGQREPFAELWGSALPADTLHEALPAMSFLMGSVTSQGADAAELAGLFAGGVDLVRANAAGAATPIAFAFIGAEAEGWHYRGEGFDAAEQSTVVRDVWFRAGSALPVETRLEVPARGFVATYRLAEHRAGTGSLPWGEEARPGPAQGELGALTARGPDDGSAALRFPLRDAVRAALADPTLPDLQLMGLRGSAVLTKAFYEVRAGGEALEPLPEARWFLVFHDAQGAEVRVESKRVLGSPVSVQREVEQRGWVKPDIDGVRAEELPGLGPTLGAAVHAFAARAGGEPTSALYELQRGQDGNLIVTVWAGTVDDGFGAGPGGVRERLGARMVGVDQDGLPRFVLDDDWDAVMSVADAGPELQVQAAAPAHPPAIAAASVGVGLAVGAAVKLLGPLYTRLDRRRVLAHPLRQRILALVEAQPGLHMEALQQQLGTGAGSTAHHVEVLARSGLVRMHRQGRYRRVYPPGVDAHAMARDAALRTPRSRALFDLVRATPGVGLRAAARELGMPASSLQWHVAQLEAAGLVERRREGLFARPA